MLFISDRLLVGWWGSRPRRALRGGGLVLLQVLVDGPAELAGHGPSRARADPGERARARCRHVPAIHGPHLLSVLVTIQPRPDQIEASGASRGNRSARFFA